MRLTVLLSTVATALGVAAGAQAGEDDWRFAGDATLYGYGNWLGAESDSVLNPGNQVARLPSRSEIAEMRANLKAENESLRFTGRAIARAYQTHSEFSTDQETEGYFSQWQARLRLAEDWNTAVGRDVLNWGPAQFRSPSSPFYFDNGRSDPMRELVGMDSAKLSWTPSMQSNAMLVYIDGPGHGGLQPDRWRDVWHDSWLVKFDQRGDGWSASLLAAKAPDLPTFYGGYGQVTVNDAVLLYGEFGSYALANWLQSPADSSQAFTVREVSSRRLTTLVGTSYTFEDGQSLAAEYLHDGHGYTGSEEEAFFQRARVMPGMALGLMPQLLGRDYLHLVWQSNMMDERGYWRLMYTHSLSDGSNELSAYGEWVLSNKVTAFAMASVPEGSPKQEFSALLDSSVTLGLKIALP